MLCIGLTGGIGSGKTTVSSRFSALGVPVIDTDLIAHALTRPGQSALNRIYEHFGPEVLSPDNQQLNRAALRALVLEDPASRKILESILHPLIEAMAEKRLNTVNAPVCLLVVPLLVESGWQSRVDRVLVVDAPDTSRRQWIKTRSHLGDDEIDALFDSQTSRQNRLDIADDIINNNQDPAHLYRQVDQLYLRYLIQILS